MNMIKESLLDPSHTFLVDDYDIEDDEDNDSDDAKCDCKLIKLKAKGPSASTTKIIPNKCIDNIRLSARKSPVSILIFY